MKKALITVITEQKANKIYISNIDANRVCRGLIHQAHLLKYINKGKKWRNSFLQKNCLLEDFY